MAEMEQSAYQKCGSDREKVGRFVAGSSALLFASLTSGVLSFVWTVIMSRLLGPEGFGLAGPFINLYWIITASVSFGVPHAMMTFISDCHHSDPERAERMMSEGARLLFAIVAVFAVAAAACVAGARAQGAIRPLTAGLAWIMLAAVVGRQMYYAVFGAIGGMQRMDLLAVCNITYPITMLASSIALVVAVRAWRPGDAGAGVLAGCGGVAIGSLVQYGVANAVAVRGGVAVRKLYAWRGRGGAGARRLLSFGWMAAAAMIAASSMQLIAPVIVSFLAHSLGNFGKTGEINAVRAGWFSGGFTYAMAPMMIVGMMLAIVPAISEAQAQNNRVLMQRYYDLAVKYAMTMIFYALSVYAAYAGRIVELFSGARFPADVMGPLTTALAVGMSLCMICLLAGNALVGLKRPGAAAAVTVTALAVEVAALAAIGRFTGSIAAEAAAFDAVALATAAALIILLRLKSGLRWPWRMLPRPIAASAATAAILMLLTSKGPVFLAGLAASAFIFFGILGLIGGLDPDDMDMARDTLRSSGAGVLSRAVDLAEKILCLSPLYKRSGDGEKK
jgi:stage V sporulation protein B